MNNSNIPVSEKISDYIEELFGTEAKNKFIYFVESEPKLSIRVNTLKTTPCLLTQRLKEKHNISSIPFTENPNAFVVEGNLSLLGISLEHILGEYYIQSRSSMLPSLALNPKEGEKVLDLCAAPGSKTTHLAELMNNRGTLVANEIQMSRLKTLVYNLERMNVVNTGVTHLPGELISKYFDSFFDKALVDAPCSGLGIVQKKEEVSQWWSIERAEKLGELQYKLLLSALKSVKVGGEIIYSTCTLTVEENEAMIDKLFKKYPIDICELSLPFYSINGITQTKEHTFSDSISKAKRILPWDEGNEGFFIIKLRKTDTIELVKDSIRKSSPNIFENKKKLSGYFNFLSNHYGIPIEEFDNFKYIRKKNDLFFICEDWESESIDIFNRIGTKFGTIDNKNELIFHTQAAQIFSKQITTNKIILKDESELKVYLEGGTIKENYGVLRQVVVEYDGLMLGSGVVTGDGLKSRFPRAKRTQKIHYY